jgi:hypothetical protein
LHQAAVSSDTWWGITSAPQASFLLLLLLTPSRFILLDLLLLACI